MVIVLPGCGDPSCCRRRTSLTDELEVMAFRSYNQQYATDQLTPDFIFHLPEGMPSVPSPKITFDQFGQNN
ncbi:unnamed protein product [Urochloa humidicola]